MRILSFIFIIAFATCVFGQTPQTMVIFEQATRRAQNAQYEKAIEIYRQAALLSENQGASDYFLARIHFNIGVCLYQLKRNHDAVKELSAAISLSKGNYEKAFYALGMAQAELKNWRSAISAFRQAVKLEQADGEAWFDLGLALLEEKDYEAARQAFQNAVRHQSRAAADAHNNLGVILALNYDFRSAGKEFQTALIKSQGKSVEARNNLEFCQKLERVFNPSLLAKLEFSESGRNKIAR